MQRSVALTKAVHMHAVVLHRINTLLKSRPDEAEARMAFMEDLCRDTLEMISAMRVEGVEDQQEFLADVLSDLASLPTFNG